MDAKTAIRKSDFLLTERSGFDSQAREIRTYIAPIAAAIGVTETPGAKRRDEILDNSSEGVSETLAATIVGELANPAEFWFLVETEKERLMRDRDVAFWCADAQEKAYRIFRNPKSGWSVMLDKWVQELVDFGLGTAPIIDQPGRGIRFRHIPIGETCLEQDADGVLNGHHRRFRLTAGQAFAEWGGKAGDKVIKAAMDDKGGEHQEFEFLRAVTPMREPDSAGRAFYSIWVNLAETHVIGERAFFEFPFMAARWKTSGNEAYARGPGHRALADVKMLQRSMKTTIRAAERAMAPPLLAPDDGIIGPISMGDNAITTFRSDLMHARQQPVIPMNTGSRPDIAEEFNAGIRERVKQAYYGHLLGLPRDPRLLQDQFLELAEERARVMGPILDRIYQQAFGPMIDRVLMILARAGVLLPLPAAMENESVKATFKSPFAQAKQVSEARAISRYFNANNALFTLAPEAMDTVDTDEMARLSGEGLGVPRSGFRDPKIVEAMRKQRAAEARARTEMELVAQGAGAAQSVAQATGGGGAAA